MMGLGASRIVAIALVGFSLIAPHIKAQSRQDPMATKILLEVGTRYKKLPGFSAEFTRESQDIKGDVQSSTNGNILVSGSKYRLKTGTTTLFCDGKTVWTADKKIKEVSIAEYDPEPDDITPERVYTFYKKGYKYIFIGEVKVGNSVWQTIDLEPENLNKEISKIRLFVDRKTKEIRKWIVFERGSNEREEFEIRKFTVLGKSPEKELRFDKAAFPGYKIVDLR